MIFLFPCLFPFCLLFSLALSLSSPLRCSFQTASLSDTNFSLASPAEAGNEIDLAKFKGKVVLVVNTASKCGFTPQYGGLEKLYKDLRGQYGDDFEILGFPCNQFGAQEPGSNDDIQSFCQVNYGVSFPILSKIDVNGDSSAPLYQWLKDQKSGLLGLKRIKWNFEKFLIGRNGQVVERWASTAKPESLEKTITNTLGAKPADPAPTKTDTAPAAAPAETTA